LKNYLFLDFETTTLNKGHPFNPLNKVISYAYGIDSDSVLFKYYSDPDFITGLRRVLGPCSAVVGFNIKFDLHWLAVLGIELPADCRVWDCSLAEFVLSGQTARFQSLNETLESYGLPVKFDKVKEYWDAGIGTEDIPVDVLEEYNVYDVIGTRDIFYLQQQLMSVRQKQLVWLMGEDLKVLQHAEFNGIKWDADKAAAKLEELRVKLDRVESSLNGILGDIPERFVFNWDSGDHLSALLYGGEINYDYCIPEMAIYKSGPQKGQEYTRNRWHSINLLLTRRFTPVEGTELKKSREDPNAKVRFYQTDQPTLLQLKSRRKEDKELITGILERSGAIKIREMILSIEGKMKEMNWQDNMLHGQFNQNVVITGRLSSSGPNLQNTPPEVDELLVSRYY
jgi:DNA polymerase I-like protein with 3'-5' exonuclease and polymerase domains